MKQLMTIAASLLLLSGVASARQSGSDESLEFRPHWSFGIQGGMAHTRGELDFGELLSPAARLSATYNFHHAMGVRAGIEGWQGKGGVITPGGWQDYAFNYGGLSADYVLDLAGLFGGFRHDRVVSPYVFAGVGGLCGFSNSQAEKYREQLEYYWDGTKFFVSGRAGVGVDFRLGKHVSLDVEGNAATMSDKFNSKRADNTDWQFNLLAGVKFTLGGNTRPSKVYAEKVAAEEAARAAAEAERLAAERAAAEKLAADEAAEKAAAEKLAAEKAAREASQKAAAERAAKAADNSDNIFFTIGSTVIRKNEDAKLVKLAEWMKENPDFTVSLIGYADRETGSVKGNEILSANRAEAVKVRLVKLGVDESRILTSHLGDTVQVFAENDRNRVVTCTLE